MKQYMNRCGWMAALIVGGAAIAAEPAPTALDILVKSVSFHGMPGNGQVLPHAQYLRGVLLDAGFAPEDVKVEPFGSGDVATATFTARFPGRDPRRKPIVLISHMDVVDARREDWERDPFTAVVEKGYVFGRGASDNKFGLSTQVAAVLNLKRAGWRPGRDVILAFSGDEETSGASAKHLASQLANAEFVLNSDAGGGEMAEDGSGPLGYGIQAGEKTYVDFTLVATDPGGHSSTPTPTNPIYRLSRALARIEPFRFPVQKNELTTALFKAMAADTPGPAGDAIRRYVANPDDQAAIDAVSSYPQYIGQLRTTCVATQLSGGHAPNALPQRATANVNCRVFPGTTVASVKETLVKVVADPTVEVSYEAALTNEAPASPLRPDVMKAVEKAVHARFPKVSIVPSMSSGATDGIFYRAVGVPTYGVGGLYMKASDDFAHGLNERVPVSELEPAVKHWESLLRDLAR